MQEITGSTTPMPMSTNMVQHILVAFDLYNLDRLKVLCKEKLYEELKADTMATTLALVAQNHCTQLKTVCLKFVATPANLGAVMQSEEFRHLEKSCPSLLSELLKIFASVKECANLLSSKKRSGGSVYGMDLVEEDSVEERVNLDDKRVRRR